MRILGLIEGTSFLLLLLAMLYRFYTGERGPVRIVGGLHGGLVIGYLLLGGIVGLRQRWPLKTFVALVLAASLPLGTFVFDGFLKREEAKG